MTDLEFELVGVFTDFVSRGKVTVDDSEYRVKESTVAAVMSAIACYNDDVGQYMLQCDLNLSLSQINLLYGKIKEGMVIRARTNAELFRKNIL